MAKTALDLPDPPAEIPVAPTEAAWRALDPRARERFVLDANAALQREAELMPEGSPHIRSKARIQQVLGDFFARMGRKIYLASELAVHYPGEPVFAPDLLAVQDVEDPGDDDARMAWVVADEGRGIDLALEVIYNGRRQKDLVDNVIRYARLGVPEYFVYDRLRQRVLGYRLPPSGARRYEPIPSRGGLLASPVLGVDLMVAGGKLRFFVAGAEVPETRELLDRLNGLVEELERRAEEEAQRAADEAWRLSEAERRAEEATRQAEEATRRAEEATRQAEEATRRAEAEAAARAELERRLAELTRRSSEG